MEAVIFISEFAANNDYILTFITAGIASLAGAWGAIHITEKNKNQEKLLLEIRTTNRAIHTARSIYKSYISTKDQCTNIIKAEWDETNKAFLAAKEKLAKTGVKDKVDPFVLTSVNTSIPKLEFLHKCVFENMFITGMPLCEISALELVSNKMPSKFEEWNQRIARCLNKDENSLYLYLGKELAGKTDYNIAHLLFAIVRDMDSLIYLSKILCHDLTSYGKSLASEYRRKYSEDPPTISIVDFTEKDLSLTPDDSEFPEWN